MEKTVALVVDDNDLNRELLCEIIDDDIDIIEAVDGEECLTKLKLYQDDISILLLDLMMPKVSGMEVLQYMHDTGLIKQIPVIIISSENDNKIKSECFNYGVTDFIHKPFDPYIVNSRLKNASELYRYKANLEHIIYEQTQQLREQNIKLNRINQDIVGILGNVVEARNLESGLHVKRVQEYSRILAEDVKQNYPEYNLTSDDVFVISMASCLHDIGKIKISDSILLKPAKLTVEEFDEMKKHTIYGCDVLKSINSIFGDDYYQTSNEVIRWHHEKYDGKGYPDGLIGDNIPISAQIVSIADIFDALTQERVYKKAFSISKAYDMIMNGECGCFSDKMKDCLTRCLPQMKDFYIISAESEKEQD